MRPQVSLTVGYTVVGLLVGLFLHPWIYLYLVRQKIAEPRDPTWAAVFYGLILVPALLFAVIGWNKARTAPA